MAQTLPGLLLQGGTESKWCQGCVPKCRWLCRAGGFVPASSPHPTGGKCTSWHSAKGKKYKILPLHELGKARGRAGSPATRRSLPS